MTGKIGWSRRSGCRQSFICYVFCTSSRTHSTRASAHTQTGLARPASREPANFFAFCSPSAAAGLNVRLQSSSSSSYRPGASVFPQLPSPPRLRCECLLRCCLTGPGCGASVWLGTVETTTTTPAVAPHLDHHRPHPHPRLPHSPDPPPSSASPSASPAGPLSSLTPSREPLLCRCVLSPLAARSTAAPRVSSTRHHPPKTPPVPIRQRLFLLQLAPTAYEKAVFDSEVVAVASCPASRSLRLAAVAPHDFTSSPRPARASLVALHLTPKASRAPRAAPPSP